MIKNYAPFLERLQVFLFTRKTFLISTGWFSFTFFLIIERKVVHFLLCLENILFAPNREIHTILCKSNFQSCFKIYGLLPIVLEKPNFILQKCRRF